MDAAQSVEETTEVLSSSISCLFTELLVLIFCYLDVRSKGRAAQVCSSWRNAAYERRVWRGVEAKLHIRSSSLHLFASLVRRGISCVQVMIKNRLHRRTKIHRQCPRAMVKADRTPARRSHNNYDGTRRPHRPRIVKGSIATLPCSVYS